MVDCYCQQTLPVTGLPRTVIGRMSIDVGLMLAEALPQIVGRANLEMTGYSYGFKNINVVHGWVNVARPMHRIRSAIARRIGALAGLGLSGQSNAFCPPTLRSRGATARRLRPLSGSRLSRWLKAGLAAL